MITIKAFRFSLLAVLGLLLVANVARGEANCAGQTYTRPDCNGACPAVNCVDVSFDQDGTLFQCCGSYVPEMSDYAAPTVALGALLIALAWRRRRQLAR